MGFFISIYGSINWLFIFIAAVFITLFLTYTPFEFMGTAIQPFSLKTSAIIAFSVTILPKGFFETITLR
jgi:hypothetical protein